MPNPKSPAPMSVEEAVKTFGKRVALARFKKGYTQVSLAKYVDLSVESIVKIENGDRSPSISSLIKLAIELDVSLDWLVLGKSDSHLLDTGDEESTPTLELLKQYEYELLEDQLPEGYYHPDDPRWHRGNKTEVVRNRLLSRIAELERRHITPVPDTEKVRTEPADEQLDNLISGLIVADTYTGRDLAIDHLRAHVAALVQAEREACCRDADHYWKKDKERLNWLANLGCFTVEFNQVGRRTFYTFPETAHYECGEHDSLRELIDAALQAGGKGK